MKIYTELLELFIMFFVGALTFGGGYAMIPVIQRNCGKKGWFDDEEISIVLHKPVYAEAITVNTATFVGYKKKVL